MRLLSNLHVKGKPAVLPDRAIRWQSHYFIYRPRIPFDAFPTRCNITQYTYFWKTALHVSGGVSTHHQEHTQVYLQYLVLVKPLVLPAAIVEVLELVLVWCGNCVDRFWCGCNRTKTDQYNSHMTLKPVPTHPQ